jgi:ribosomal protein L37AE/L43A
VAAENNNNEKLINEIAADILARARESKGYSIDASRLRDEIIKDIGSRDLIFGKFLELLEALRHVIPGEENLYHAALKSLSTTSGISQKDVLGAADTRLSELKRLGEAFKSALGGWRDDVKGMESKSLEIRKEISKFREKIGQLEKEERQILDGMAARSKEIELAQNGIAVLMSDIAAEITGIKAKLEEFASERGPLQPVSPPDSVKDNGLETDVSGGAVEVELQPMSAPQDTEGSKKCSVCGGQSMWYESEKIWKCYVCGHEDKEDTEVPGAREKTAGPQKPAPAQAQKPEPPRAMTVAAPQEIPSVQKRPAVKTKTCPICKKNMEWHEREKSWRCPFCKYQRMAFS